MKNYLAILFLFFGLAGFPVNKKNNVKYDSMTVSSIKKATAEKEKEIFADKDFQYHEEAKESKNWIRAFFDWLMENIFGKMSVESGERAWTIIKWIFIVFFV